MKNADELGYAGRYDSLEPVVSNSFDFPIISRIVLGRYWKKLGDQQKTAFIETFSKLSTATYASRFDGYSGEEFKYLGEQQLKKSTLVKSVLVRTKGDTVSLNYAVHQTCDKWLIVNIFAQGTSDLGIKRADYSSVMKKGGFEALLAKLNDKIANFENARE